MSILVFLIGITITTLLGWLAVGLVQGKSMVLSRGERLSWGLTLGPTLGMFSVFLCHVLGFTRLNLFGFLAPQLVLIAILAVAAWRQCSLHLRGRTDIFAPRTPHPRWMTLGIGLLCAWTALKILAGTYDLVNVPTYWDDSFNNWNMRGKMFFVTQELRLEIPAGNGVTITAASVSSYPPTLPLMKTFTAVLRGQWSEPLSNGIHLVWFAGLLSTLYFTLRRSFDPLLSSLGVYALVSLPLVLIHGSNPYAEIFVAAHVLIAASALLGLRKAVTNDEALPWTRLFFLVLGLLALTKNEGLIIHTTLLLLMSLIVAFQKRGLIESTKQRKKIALGFGIFLMFLVPWLLFKWSNGLTFGNTSSVSKVSLSFSTAVVSAIWFHLSQEPNWLLLPLVLPLALLAGGRRFWRSPEAILAVFVLTEITVQFGLFTMVQSLATEAVKQTGLSRGLLQIAPVAVLTCAMALRSTLMLQPQPKAPQAQL